MGRFAAEAIESLKTYPPKPAKSRYRRKGDRGLKGGWESDVDVGGDFEVDIFNDVDYAGYVQGRRFAKNEVNQLKRFQKAGWVSLTDIDKLWRDQYRFRVAAALKLDLKRLAITRS